THRPSVVIPIGTTSYLSRSSARSTLPAVTHDTACSELRPPNTTATRGLLPVAPSRVSGLRSNSLIALTLLILRADRRHRRPVQVSKNPAMPDSTQSLALSTRSVTAGRPRRDPDAPLNAPLVLAST